MARNFVPGQFTRSAELHDGDLVPGPVCGEPGEDPLQMEDSYLPHDNGDRPQDPGDRPPPCRCHDLPLGSCPTIIQQHIDNIVKIRSFPGSLANMDGARIPLLDPPINPAPWRRMLGKYFDKDNLLDAFTFGWDLSLLDEPAPRESRLNKESPIRLRLSRHDQQIH